MQLRKASRKKSKIRLGLSGVSGSGKTYSALLIAFGIVGDWSKIAVIDTENGSADLYENLGDYNVYSLTPPFSPERYIEAIQDCENGGMEVIIIDSISHEWEGTGGILELADQIGGGFSGAWKTLTPRHDRFKQAILQSTCHIITTVRRKQDYILQEDVNKHGKTVQKPVKMGLKEVTREGWEYELTVNLEIDVKHLATASKDRTELFINKDPFKPSIETGKQIREWCERGLDEQEEARKAAHKFEQDCQSVLAKLPTCDTVEALTKLKEEFSYEVMNSKDVKEAAVKRFKEVTKPKPEPTAEVVA